MKNTEIKLYSPEEIAEITGLNRETIYRHIRSGKLKGLKIGGSWRITESELKKYLGVWINE